MRSFLLCLFLTLTLTAFSQQSTNQLIGYQEFPTTIKGYASDSAGNQYYTGVFKGELKVSDKVLTAGEGQEDLFWIKMDANGQLIRYYTYGSSNTETMVENVLTYHENNTLSFAARIIEPVGFGSITVEPYKNVTTGNPLATSAIVHTDTAGSVKWITKTTLPILKIHKVGHIIHAIGNINLLQQTVKVGDSTLISSTSKIGLMHLMLDTTGKLLNTKTIFASDASGQIALQHFSNYRDNKLFFALRVTSKNNFEVNGQAIALPINTVPYYVFINTDTSFLSFKSKLINPVGHPLTGHESYNWPIHLGANDSIYTVNVVEWGMPQNGAIVNYVVDGYSVPNQRNTLIVYDSSLKAKRTVNIGQAVLTNTPELEIEKHRFYYRNIIVRDNNLYFTVNYLGTNESSSQTIPKRDTSLHTLSGILMTINLNGPSMSYVAKTNLGVTSSKLAWYGDHTEYESSNIAVSNFQFSGKDRLFFSQSVDNVWNPWLFDQNLNKISGSMKRNADGPESIRMVQYLSDGSRIVIGYAKGKTALDKTNTKLPSNTLRKDVFISRIQPNGDVSWFKRFNATLLQGEIRKLIVRNDKAYFLVNYTGVVNDSNYISIDNQTYSIPLNASILGYASVNGDITVLNLKQSDYKNTKLRDFSFFSNGDLVLLSNDIDSSHPSGLPDLLGFPLLRIDGNTGVVREFRKFVSNLFPPVNRIEVDKDDAMYLTFMVVPTFVPPYTNTYRLHDGVKYIDAITVQHNSGFRVHHGLIKMQWDKFLWFKRFSGDVNTALTSQQDLFLVNQKPVLLITTQVDNKPLYWDGQLVHNGAGRLLSTWVQLDTAGVMKNNKVLPNVYVTNARKGTGEQLYLSGYINKQTTIDTITLDYSGFTDAVGIVVDSNFRVKKSYRLHTPYSEVLYDFDVYLDSVVTFAYVAQTDPAISKAKFNAEVSDYQEDAYLGTLVIKSQTPTGINQPLPVGTSVAITPNPVRGKHLQLTAHTPELLPSVLLLYTAEGQFIGSRQLRLMPGASRYAIPLPEAAKPGIYQVVISNKKWKVVRSFLKL
jgi:hypothetical protein